MAEKSSSWRADEKITKQMEKRGWNGHLVDDTINRPHRTVKTRDTRYESDGSGRRRDDPATAYIREDGSYVVRNDKTQDIIQISDRMNPNWKNPF